jgi:hypothetical protein
MSNAETYELTQRAGHSQLRRGPLVMLQLNEINFDLVARYMEVVPLPGFRQLLTVFKRCETFAEDKYEELEPWIQWVSAFSGKRYAEHGVFRLGDGTKSQLPQIFEILEQHGLRIGAISPMNTRNELKRPAYFIPDPWTSTASDSAGFSRRLTAMLQQTVNENAQGKISLRSLVTLAEAIARSFDLRGTLTLLSYIFRTRRKAWYKSLVLDQLIHRVHVYLLRKTRPDVSFVFLNAGAHIQHHYYFNSRFVDGPHRNPDWYVTPGADPVLDMLVVYDKVVQDYLGLCAAGGGDLIVATGLSQVPYDRVKFYYRLKSHIRFVEALGLSPLSVMPRMTRDFEILFTDAASAAGAAKVLASARVVRDDAPLFGDIEIRDKSLFVTLTYPREIIAGDRVCFDGGFIDDLPNQVAFVAIKNGMHCTKGYAFFSPGSPAQPPAEPVHVASLFRLTMDAAGVE